MGPELIENLARAGRRRRLFVPAAAHALEFGRPEVERLLPHRDPFLFVDRITAADFTGLAIAGERRIDPCDPLFRGHFPDEPIYPGMLQLETMGQLGLCLFALLKNGRQTITGDDRPRPALALKIHHAAFLALIRPGDDLLVFAKVIDADAYTGVCAGQILKGDIVCSFAVMEVYFVES